MRLLLSYIRAPRWGWLAPALIVLVAGISQVFMFWRIRNGHCFFQTYYAKNAHCSIIAMS